MEQNGKVSKLMSASERESCPPGYRAMVHLDVLVNKFAQ